MFEGILLVVLGIIAILVPEIFTLAIATLIGILLVIGGAMSLYRCTKAGKHAGHGWHVLAALLAIVAGVLLLVYPLHGTLTLTIILIALFFAQGVVKTIASWRMRPRQGWGWNLFNGLVDIALGVILWAGLPWSALWAIGLLVGISLLFAGWTAIMLAAGMRRMASTASS